MRPKLSTLLKNIKLVRLVNDRYAIRKGWIFYEYLDPTNDKWRDKPYTDICTSDQLHHIANYYDFRFMNTGVEVEIERYRDGS